MGNLFSNCKDQCLPRRQPHQRQRLGSSSSACSARSTGGSRSKPRQRGPQLLHHHDQDDADETDSWADYDWHDALMDHDDLEPQFEVTDDELRQLKEGLSEKFPKDWQYMSDDYILSVASKPYSKDTSIRRPLEYTMEKLMDVMEWRRKVGAPELQELVAAVAADDKSRNESNGGAVEAKKESALPPEKMKLAGGMARSLNAASMYWHGCTKHGHPILWIRTQRKPWYPNVQDEINALIVMADAGIVHGMPMRVTDFVVISHSHQPPPPNPRFAYQMLQGLVKGYPDRLNCLISAPVSSIVEFCMNLLLPLMPGRLPHKFIFLSTGHCQEKLAGLLLNGYDDVPTFFGGPNTDHDKFYPDESNYPPATESSLLKFDFLGMVERMKQQRKEYDLSHRHITFKE